MRLAGLVQDLNTLTSLEREAGDLSGENSPGVSFGAAEKLCKTEFDLAKLLGATAEQFRAAASGKGIEIKLNLRESPVTADYDRLKQVFINLLSNAVKYTDRGSVTVTVGEREPALGASPPGRWEVTVADTGIGIPAGDLPHIFERFYRSDKSRSRSTGGAGIGLTIAAAIVRAHGGTISAESRDDETAAGSSTGSVFRVAL
jgi:signal transduction histidine kinase